MNTKASYTNKMAPIAITRIMSDRSIVFHDEKGYRESNIHFNFNDKDTIDNEFRILTVGSLEISNPYFGGFFMFGGSFPDQYPFFPPHILAKTQGSGTRFHPNYYVNGKCCLSILGTWAGPPWTSCQNLGTTSQALKSLFIENPITQEPSWENCIDERALKYRKVVEYRTLKIAVLNMLSNPPMGFEEFIPIMEKYFLELYPKYIEKLDSLEKYNGQSVVSPIYNDSRNFMKITYNIPELRELYEHKFKYLSEKHNYAPVTNKELLHPMSIGPESTNVEQLVNSDKTIELDSNSSDSIKNIVFKKKNSTRKSPNEKASTYKVGFKHQSSNDNNWYIVFETKNGQKRWKKCLA